MKFRDSSLPSDSRRSFVKKSLATSVAIPFAGLIRAAHGATILPYDSTNPWSDSTEVTDPWSDGSGGSIDLGSIDDFTLPTDYTVDAWSWFSIDPPEDNSVPFTICQPNAHDYFSVPLTPPVNGKTWKNTCLKCGTWYLSTSPHP